MCAERETTEDKERTGRLPPKRLGSNQHLPGEWLCSRGSPPRTRERVPAAPSLPWGELKLLPGV